MAETLTLLPLILFAQQGILAAALRVAADIADGRPFTRIYLNPVCELTRRQIVKTLTADRGESPLTSEVVVEVCQNLIKK